MIFRCPRPLQHIVEAADSIDEKVIAERLLLAVNNSSGKFIVSAISDPPVISSTLSKRDDSGPRNS